MKDEINRIIQSISDFYKLDNALKYYLDRNKAQILLDYITNLQKEIKQYQKELEKADSITQMCIFDGSRSAGKSYRQCLNWLEDYKSRNEKAKSLTNRTIEIIKQQPSGNDEWILERLNGINYCLGCDEE